MIPTGEARSSLHGEMSAHLSLWSSQLHHELVWDRTQVSAGTDQRQNAWAVTKSALRCDERKGKERKGKERGFMKVRR